MGIGTIPEPTGEFFPLGDTGLEVCVWRGLVWIKGRCGAHSMSPDAARQLGDWLGDLSHPVIEGTVEP